jgi:hypothetical protein
MTRRAEGPLTGLAAKQEKIMNQRNVPPTADEAADYEFDGTQLATIPVDGCDFQKLEWGSDVHIAFLEQAVKGLQEALADAKAVRANANR